MRYVFRLDTTCRLENNDNIYKYEVISIVFCRILSLLEKKIKNENQNLTLNEKEIVLLCHLSAMCNQLVTQCTLFDWSSEMKDTNKDRIESAEKRRIRAEFVTFQMQKLFPISMVHSLIDIIFDEMSKG